LSILALSNYILRGHTSAHKRNRNNKYLGIGLIQSVAEEIIGSIQFILALSNVLIIQG